MKKMVEMIKRLYPAGTNIVVDYMEDPHPLPPGSCGTVDCVDDIGTIHCRFENGRRLGLIYGTDSFHKLTGGKISWMVAAAYIEKDYNGIVDWSERFFICPHCDEIVYEYDWNDKDFFAKESGKLWCPICQEII